MKALYLVLFASLILSCQTNKKIDRTSETGGKTTEALDGPEDNIAPVVDSDGQITVDGDANSTASSEAIDGDGISTEPTAVSESLPVTPSCDLKINRKIVNFGSPKVTSRAFRRLRFRSAGGFRILSVSQFDKPFDFYNNVEFPGEATYHDYSLCQISETSNDCSVNLEFRPRAVASYNSAITVKYLDSAGNNCSMSVGLRGNSTESYLGKDSSKNNKRK